MSSLDGITTPLLKTTAEDHESAASDHALDDDEWGGTEGRRRLEQGLLWKLDKRMSILILIYILNYVRLISCPSERILGH